MTGYTAKGRLALSLLALGALGAALAGCGGGGTSTAPLATGGDTKGVVESGNVSGRGVIISRGKSGDSSGDDRDKPLTRKVVGLWP